MNTPGSTPKKEFVAGHPQFPGYDRLIETSTTRYSQSNSISPPSPPRKLSNSSSTSSTSSSNLILKDSRVLLSALPKMKKKKRLLSSIDGDQNDDDDDDDLSNSSPSSTDLLSIDFPAPSVSSSLKLPELKFKKKKKKPSAPESQSLDFPPSRYRLSDLRHSHNSHNASKPVKLKALRHSKSHHHSSSSSDPKKMLPLPSSSKRHTPQSSIFPHKVLLLIISYLPTHYIMSKIRMVDTYWSKKVRKSKSMWMGGWRAFVRQMSSSAFDPLSSSSSSWRLTIHSSIPSPLRPSFHGQSISSSNLLSIHFSPSSSLIRSFRPSRKLRYLFHWFFFLSSVSDRIELSASKAEIARRDDVVFYDRTSIIVFYKSDFQAVIILNNKHSPPPTS